MIIEPFPIPASFIPCHHGYKKILNYPSQKKVTHFNWNKLFLKRQNLKFVLNRNAVFLENDVRTIKLYLQGALFYALQLKY